MKKQVFKRKKLGMALILTLMVSVVAVAIASSYIGMVGAHSKAARSYTKEAVALSLAKTGLNATINAMGVPSNWATEADTFINTFNLAGAGAEGCLHISNIDHNPNNIEGMLMRIGEGLGNFVAVMPAAGNEALWFGNNYDFLTQDPAHVQIYKTTDEIPIAENLSGALVIAVTPEYVNLVNGIPKNNVNYAVGVAALIFDRGSVPNTLDQGCFDRLLSSRVVKYRVSNVFPGSMYQNMAAADYPGTNHAADGHFGYPNWLEMTADAAFMDENTQWDGAMSIDGAKANPNVNDNTTTWGASMTGTQFDPENIEGYLAGNSSVDTSGFLKISLLNRNTDITTVNDETDDALLPKIAKQATAEKILVYSNLVNNNKTSFAEENMGAARNKITNNNIPEERAKGTNFSSIWNRTTTDGERSLLSGVDGSGNALDGTYRQLKTQGGADIPSHVSGNTNGYINYTADDYQPDPMYGNETMEVPTVRITIRQNASGNDEYLVQRIGYIPDTTNPPNATGWVEQVMEDTVLTSDNIDGMIYVGGANVQVRGTASQSVSIVSDVNSVIEQENYQVEHGLQTGTHFNRNLNSPNVRNGNTFSYIDAQLNDNGTWGATNWEGTTWNDDGASSLISTVNEAAYESAAGGTNYRLNRNGGDYVFPTYGADEQPSGNITVIGDLNTVEGTNPVVGLIAKNRVLLNDFGHTIENSQNPLWEDRNSAHDLIPANSSGDAAGDGILTVKAVVASETHNMCFDFNNVSKNLEYITHENATHHDVNRFTGREFAPGNQGDPGQGAAGFTADRTNYGMLLNNNLATRLGLNTSENMVTDDGNGNATFYLNKYSRLLPSAQRMIWSDVFRGAIRPDWDGVPVAFRFDPQFFSNGTLNFHGMIISRFGDINADAGTRAADGGRENQLGYVNQFINFDTNLQDNSAPYFSTASQIFNASSSYINWNILSYVDKGSFNLQQGN